VGDFFEKDFKISLPRGTTPYGVSRRNHPTIRRSNHDHGIDAHCSGSPDQRTRFRENLNYQFNNLEGA
jgi:hypothetical protein